MTTTSGVFVVFVASAPLLVRCTNVDCYGTLGPVTGSPEDFTTAPGERDGYSVLAPVSCEAGDVDFLQVTGQGTRHLVEGWLDVGCDPPPDARRYDATEASFSCFVKELRATVTRAGVKVLDAGRFCVWKSGSIQIDDWRQADLTVRLLAEQIVKWDLDDSFSVLVRGVALPVPHVCTEDD
jgi:hypothetical protein